MTDNSGPHISLNIAVELTYASPLVIVTSGPSSSYPQRAYRNPTDALVRFLDSKHGENWAIWEFRAEGTGYPDSEVYDRIWHYPWPDHHPPPFALMPNIMASMRNWVKDSNKEENGRVIVVHCKAGKGRSGTVVCSYLISEEKWSRTDALTRFTARRMRAGFGEGVSIPSQLRWVGYVEQWTNIGKVYMERHIEILELHVWGLRDGVKVAIEGFVDEGKTIKTFHVFNKKERLVVDHDVPNGGVFAELAGFNKTSNENKAISGTRLIDGSQIKPQDHKQDPTGYEVGGGAVIFRPTNAIVLPTSDICIDFERRNRATYGWTMVTSVAHVWFNAFFEGLGTDRSSKSASNGIFEIEWDAMDGIKGSSRKGTKALDRLSVVWRALDDEKQALPHIITEPALGAPVPEAKPADWHKANAHIVGSGKDLGLRVESPGPSTNPSRASSIRSAKSPRNISGEEEDDDSMAGVQTHGPNGETNIPHNIEEPSGDSLVTTNLASDGVIAPAWRGT